MSIEEKLRDFARAYPEDVFTPVTASERKAYPTLITKAAADMGRHFAPFALEAADLISALEAELNEQARVNGMGGSREAVLLAKVARLEAALYNVVHCSLEPGVVKRAEIALGLVTAETSAQRARVPTTNHANLNEACQEILRVLATEKEQK